MANKLFVGSLAWGVDDNMLYQAFASFGQISEAKVMMERDDPGKSRGFGFVTFVDPSCAERAAGEMNGQDLGGRCINVEPPQMGGCVDTEKLLVSHVGLRLTQLQQAAKLSFPLVSSRRQQRFESFW